MVLLDKSDSVDDKSDDDGSGSGSAGTCTFPFHFDESVGRVGESVDRVSGVSLAFFFQKESSQLVTFFYWSCLYQKDSSSKVVDS